MSDEVAKKPADAKKRQPMSPDEHAGDGSLGCPAVASNATAIGFGKDVVDGFLGAGELQFGQKVGLF